MTGNSKTTGYVRMALMAVAFLALTIVLIVFQPGSPRHSQTISPPDATTAVTRKADPISDATTGGTRVAVDTTQPQLSAEPTIRAATTPQSGAQPTNMRDMTFSAISNLKSVTTGEAPAPGQPGSLLHSVVQRSIANATGTGTVAPEVTEIEPVSTSTRRTPNAGSYFVRPGDTLLSISREVYGDTSMSSELFQQNTNILTSPDSLTPGMVLKLPTP
ncbi:LysM peptidoglycan-binding domain-containing protein [Marivita sp. XM-24bin2]|jgi:nucleoid-associated protein YgaU|uniref:LysM peptidoglycan-binding domain-containing protein n=1 Tax=unclassified Marivita TaxID=2632480 RepID=UPI000D7B8B7C|nr:LysM peptidoglycan-binding domain-containing protein [Marivita sp. XM-24bin2]MCR9110613.1 LysM peptidoglycan-binding domain-containing protein [Paracoccaceae bacterium]PWL37011.1 MAG: hypothetical protein DCO97_00335 [Marivita sp. XM-24bin2]